MKKNYNFSIECERAVINGTKKFIFTDENEKDHSVALAVAESVMKLLEMLLPHKKEAIMNLPIENQLAIADSLKWMDAEYKGVKAKK